MPLPTEVQPTYLPLTTPNEDHGEGETKTIFPLTHHVTCSARGVATPSLQSLDIPSSLHVPFLRWYTERTRELIKWNTSRRQGEKQGAALFLLAKGGDCSLIELVLRLHNAVVIATAKEPVGHQGFDLQEKEIVIKRKEAIGAGFLYAIAHNTFVGSKDKEVVEQAEGVAIGKKGIEIDDAGVGTVFVGPDLGELVEETFAPTGLVESGGGSCVHGASIEMEPLMLV